MGNWGYFTLLIGAHNSIYNDRLGAHLVQSDRSNPQRRVPNIDHYVMAI